MRLYQDIEIKGVLIRIWELRIIDLRNFYYFAKDLKSLQEEEIYIAGFFKRIIEYENAFIKDKSFNEDDFIKLFSCFKEVNKSVFVDKEESNDADLSAEELKIKSFDEFNERLKNAAESFNAYSDMLIDLSMAGFNINDIGISAYPQIMSFVKRNHKSG